MADTAPQTDFVGKPVYPEISNKPKVRRAPQTTARKAQPATVAQIGARRQKPVDSMSIARAIRLSVAGMAR
jgi:hypothetical protein